MHDGARSEEMIEQELTLTNRLGLHARAAARLVHTAARFRCTVSVAHDGESADAKSILGLLLLAAEQGAILVVRCHGDDEKRALKAIERLFAERFGESS